MAPLAKSAQNSHGVTAEQAKQAIRTLLSYVGENPDRNGLQDTPDRVCRAWLEMTSGYDMDAKTILSTTFEGSSDEMVILKDIDFVSVCEHHMLTFQGKAHVAYLPEGGRIVGLSKLARVVDVFANRLQVQERLTQQIADAVEEALTPSGVAVVIEGSHSCMCVRGVRKQGGVMITSSLKGMFRNNAATRAEFMSLISSTRPT